MEQDTWWIILGHIVGSEKEYGKYHVTEASGLRTGSATIYMFSRSKEEYIRAPQGCQKALPVLWLRVYLNPKSIQHNSPKPIIMAIKAIILPTFGVQVVLRVIHKPCRNRHCKLQSVQLVTPSTTYTLAWYMNHNSYMVP